MPTPNVSVVDLVIQTEKKTFAEEVNEAFRESARGPQKVTTDMFFVLVYNRYWPCGYHALIAVVALSVIICMVSGNVHW